MSVKPEEAQRMTNGECHEVGQATGRPHDQVSVAAG